jgi:hypothetical protein
MRQRPRLEVLEDRTLLSTYLVTNTGDAGTGTLRQAIIDANANATGTAASPDLIQFNIPSTDPGHVYYKDDGVAGQVSHGNVAVTTATDDSTIADIDPDWAHSWWKITLQSTLPSINVPVFINGYSQSGASWNTLANDDNAILRIELNGGGPGASGNGDGLTLAGGNSAVRGLVINGLGYHYGIVLLGGGNDLVQGNFIGTDVSGLIAPYGLPNFSTFGVSSSDLHEGVHLIETLGFQHDYIGTDSRADPIDPPGWTYVADRNILSAAAAGVVFWGPGNTDPSQYGVAQTNNVVAGNFIGTDAHGTTALGNWIGIAPLLGAHDDLVGTDGNGVNDAGERNVISGNRVGVSPGGGTALASYRDAVAGNYIGVGADGSPLGNLGSGVVESIGSLSDRIGGPSATLGNRIAYNGTFSDSLHYDLASKGQLSANAPGVWIFTARSTPENARVQGNSIHDNAGLGIDLGGAYPSPGPNGVTLNDSQGHSGPNNWQNFPVLGVAEAGSVTTITGTFTEAAEPNTTLTLDFYANSAADPSGYGQGQRYLGSAQVTTDPAGNSHFVVNLGAATSPGEFISATATDPNGNTSEFAEDITAVTDVPLNATGAGTITANEGQSLNAIQVASFNDPASDGTTGSYAATINWGDNTTATSGSIAPGGASFTVSGSHTYDEEGTYTVTVTITDAGGSSITAFSTTSVGVVAPTAGLSGPALGVPGQPRTFTFTATHPSQADTQAGFIYNVNWGDGTAQAPDILTIPRTTGNGAGVATDHVYTTPGAYTVSVTATEDGGSTSPPVSQAISVQQVVMEGNSLAVGGSLAGGDTIIVSAADTSGTYLNVTIDKQSFGNFTATDHIFVYGQGGKDKITLKAFAVGNTNYNIQVPAFLYGGGSGGDRISAVGSSANNVLVGHGTNEVLTGGLGRDLLIAGSGGAATLNAGSADDILIGGYTNYDLANTAMTYDQKLTALDAIMAEWGSSDSYATRVNYLSNGGGPNGSYLLNASTVRDDNGPLDTLIGASKNIAALDWFFAGATDIINNQKSGEVVTTIF